MTLGVCRHCRYEPISKSARSCPRCGGKKPYVVKVGFSDAVISIALLVGLGFIVSRCDFQGSKPKGERTDKEATSVESPEAEDPNITLAKSAIRTLLEKNPGRFGWPWPWNLGASMMDDAVLVFADVPVPGLDDNQRLFIRMEPAPGTGTYEIKIAMLAGERLNGG